MKSSQKESGSKGSSQEASKPDDASAKAKIEREWHLRNVIETTKGRSEIRELFLALKKPKKAAAKVDEAAPELPLSQMIDAILAAEYPA